MKALITGANGHIGNHVVRASIDAGIEPVALVRRGADRRALAGLDVAITEGDLFDAAGLETSMRGAEIVMHVASPHKNWAADEKDILRPAEEGTRNVVEAAKRAGVRPARGTTAARMIPIGPRKAQSANQKQPPRPFVVAIHAPMTPRISHAGSPSHSLCMPRHSTARRAPHSNVPTSISSVDARLKLIAPATE
jgi:nucleoside-diphosphate-sugar epimerase